MKSENVIKNKTYNFSLKIIEFYKNYINSKKPIYPLANQLLKSGTSIGANVEEASAAQTKKDFYAKMTIAFKEANETKYWINLFLDSNIGNKNLLKELYNQIVEINKILTQILRTTRQNLGYEQR